MTRERDDCVSLGRGAWRTSGRAVGSICIATVGCRKVGLHRFEIDGYVWGAWRSSGGAVGSICIATVGCRKVGLHRSESDGYFGEDSSLCCFFAFVDFSVVAYVFEADGDLFADA